MQLYDEVVHDFMNCQNRDLSYRFGQVTDTRLDDTWYMGQPNSIIVLLNIIKEYAKEDTFLWVCQSLTDNGLGN